MNVSLRSSLIRLTCIALLGAAGVTYAGGGRIQLSGAVVEPTCAVEVGVPESGAGRHACGTSATSPGRTYTRHVVALTATAAHGDPLLTYFLDRSSVGTAARMMVQTYD